MPEQKPGAVLGSGNLVLDDNPGREALYVIASRRPLDQADPQLDKALATARPGDASVDCGSRLERLMAGPASPPSTTQAALPAPATAPPAPSSPKPPRASAHALEFERPPVTCVRNARAEIVRGMGVEGASGDSVKAESNAEGVVVLRFGFEHRPKPAPAHRGAPPLLAQPSAPHVRACRQSP
ncbi:MAG TPA: hypothetical protein VFS43_10230 [Polyangiaceae bacterium]|nr:hypothetical protein [Polyangiaceae bacterium]